jgi:hypothetical protein
MLRTPLIGAVLAAIAAGCAPQPPSRVVSAAPASLPARGGQCFYATDVSGFNKVSDSVVDVNARAQSFRLELVGRCPEVVTASGVSVRPRGTSTRICAGADADLIVPTGIGPRVCPIRAIRTITRAEFGMASPAGS